ncbi:hypothetical protein [Propylenella binzhouense]|uniref:DNA-binding protein n=1 Tax=Propylenella binzhouense TaxID=2555902 RepID=A0A964T1R7_9HYPH|nr:hypothetical protein [Propylenella binzhouense]MYZ46798.1 hypothetical protein [Propylenella binzhouense]
MILADERLLTYDELASAFGLTRRSARQFVGRKGWSRSKGSDGRARVHVPVDALYGGRPGIADTPAGTALAERVERLERELATALRERDEARVRATDLGIRAAQAKAMCEVLEARLGVAEARREGSFWSRIFRFAPA